VRVRHGALAESTSDRLENRTDGPSPGSAPSCSCSSDSAGSRCGPEGART
jgi:hypothetical protein